MPIPSDGRIRGRCFRAMQRQLRWRLDQDQLRDVSLIARAACCVALLAGPALGLDIVIHAGRRLARNAEALAAVDRAAQQWEQQLSDPVQVRIDVDLAPLSPDTLAETSSMTVTRSYDSVVSAMRADALDESDDALVSLLPSYRQFDAQVPARFPVSSRLQLTRANAKALGLTGLGSSLDTDATITFSADAGFDYDNSDGVSRRHGFRDDRHPRNRARLGFQQRRG